ncbi:MAG TPA: uracil-DNA glycosylase family protein [Chitinophagaceae bacterium]|nr:uracil-DNA glycosylase family protein [Chitinophagaceae bacterium]
MTFGEHILSFISTLQFPVTLPTGIEVMTPFDNEDTMQACALFYKKFYNDNNPRQIIIGINPGRFGGGVTGIPFTDPIRLQDDCGIINNWPKKQELSSVYMYEMMKAFGGVEAFYGKFYVSAVSPLGFTRGGKNLNYYDDKALQQDIRPFVIECLQQQLLFGIDRQKAFCLGDGKNFAFLSALNREQQFFETIVPLSHPRFIMQYKLRKKAEYIQHYITALQTN